MDMADDRLEVWDATATVTAAAVLPDDHPMFPSADQVQSAVLFIAVEGLVSQGWSRVDAHEWLDAVEAINLYEHRDGGIAVVLDHPDAQAVLRAGSSDITVACQMIAEAM